MYYHFLRSPNTPVPPYPLCNHPRPPSAWLYGSVVIFVGERFSPVRRPRCTTPPECATNGALVQRWHVYFAQYWLLYEWMHRRPSIVCFAIYCTKFVLRCCGQSVPMSEHECCYCSILSSGAEWYALLLSCASTPRCMRFFQMSFIQIFSKCGIKGVSL